MIRHTGIGEFCQDLGEMLNQVQCRRDSVVINKDGRPVAALALYDRLEAGFSEVPEPEGMAEIEKAISEDRVRQMRLKQG
jgi:hypothetical protein